MSKNWFEVSTEGFRAIQLGKPKWYAVREILQNAFDEKITECRLQTTHDSVRGKATFTVEDDNPEGFKDLQDAFTLYRDCYKRPDPTKRGRNNIGEKQAIAICDYAEIESTTGTWVFDDRGRHKKLHKRDSGSKVTLVIDMTKADFEDTLKFVRLLIVPKEIKFTYTVVYVHDPERNHALVCEHKEPDRTFETTLLTEYLKEDRMVRTTRKTKVELYKPTERAYLFEIGIPVCPIDCEFSINVSQRVPMSIDRDTVSQSYLQDLYAEVLRQTYTELPKDKAADTWVNIALADDRLKDKDDPVAREAVKTIVKDRYGDKVCSASPGDPRSVDDAICKDFNVVHGRELPSDVWDTFRKHEAIPSSTRLFGRGVAEYCKPIQPNEDMNNIAIMAQHIAQETLGIWPDVEFVESDATDAAWYGGRKLTFNVEQLGAGWFAPPLTKEHIALIIHELAHEGGEHHTEGYYKTLASIGAHLVMMALKEPGFFKLG